MKKYTITCGDCGSTFPWAAGQEPEHTPEACIAALKRKVAELEKRPLISIDKFPEPLGIGDRITPPWKRGPYRWPEPYWMEHMTRITCSTQQDGSLMYN